MLPAHPSLVDGGPLRVAIRPERLSIADFSVPPENLNRVLGIVEEVVYVGDAWRIHVTAGSGKPLMASLGSSQASRAMSLKKGDSVEMWWLPEDTRILEEP
jgi:ABC-type Fe3+/spermidine/putrescine transport system ATPase subunit